MSIKLLQIKYMKTIINKILNWLTLSNEEIEYGILNWTDSQI